MKISKLILLVPMVALLLTGCSEKETVTNEELSFCKQLDEIDLKMLNMIKEIEKLYQGDKAFLVAFKDAQIYWIQYRNRHVKAIFPLSPKKYAYNVGECKCEVYRDLTQDRVRQLQKWIDGVDQDQNCKGSYRVN